MKASLIIPSRMGSLRFGRSSTCWWELDLYIQSRNLHNHCTESPTFYDGSFQIFFEQVKIRLDLPEWLGLFIEVSSGVLRLQSRSPFWLVLSPFHCLQDGDTCGKYSSPARRSDFHMNKPQYNDGLTTYIRKLKWIFCENIVEIGHVITNKPASKTRLRKCGRSRGGIRAW